jgi:hypothetical protein
MSGVCAYERMLSPGELRVRTLAREAAKARRRALFARKEREHAAIGVRVTVRLRNGVTVETRGMSCGGSRAGTFGSRESELLNLFRS